VLLIPGVHSGTLQTVPYLLLASVPIHLLGSPPQQSPMLGSSTAWLFSKASGSDFPFVLQILTNAPIPWALGVGWIPRRAGHRGVIQGRAPMRFLQGLEVPMEKLP
jgi:hypothetical protein